MSVEYLLARKPVFNDRYELFAYEIIYRRLESSAEKSGSDEYFGIDLKRIIGEGKAFVGFSAEMIRNGVPKKFPREKLIIVVSGREIASDSEVVESCRKLKSVGFSFAIDDFKRGRGLDEIMELCDYVMLDFSNPQNASQEASYICGFTNKRIVAENIGTRDNFEAAKKLGCAYAEGDFYKKPVRDLRNIQPLPVSIAEAMKVMMKQEPDVDEIVEILSHDTAVCQKILRLINSAYFGVTSKISSIGQAIIVLGLNYLREWIYMLAIQHISQNDSPELMRLSLITAKFCRKLASEIPAVKGESEAFYLMGLLSMLVFSGERNTGAILEELPITSEIKNGILRRGGAYSDVFGMAVDFANGEWESFLRAAEKCGIEPEKAAGMYAEALESADRTDLG